MLCCWSLKTVTGRVTKCDQLGRTTQSSHSFYFQVKANGIDLDVQNSIYLLSEISMDMAGAIGVKWSNPALSDYSRYSNPIGGNTLFIFSAEVQCRDPVCFGTLAAKKTPGGEAIPRGASVKSQLLNSGVSVK